jgi:hypothetical protein
MKRSMPAKLALIPSLIALCLTIPAMAQNTRSWVSHEGKDQNDCTINHPCRTFQRAHNQTQIGGEVDVLDPGEYGTLVIDHPITLDGGHMGYIDPTASPVFDAIVVGQTTTSLPVILRNLSIQGAAVSAINWLGTGHLNVHGVTILHSGIGIHVSPLSEPPGGAIERTLDVEDTTIVEAGQAGILVEAPAATANLPPAAVPLAMTVLRTSIAIRQNGPSASAGIALQAGKAQAVQCTISGNQTGVQVGGKGQPAEINLEDSTIAFSSFAAVDALSGIVRLAANNIHDNATALFTSGSGQIISFGNNRIAGNTSGETPSSTVSLK